MYSLVHFVVISNYYCNKYQIVIFDCDFVHFTVEIHFC